MKEERESLKEHNCGFCGKTSCIAYGISPDGSCPFDREGSQNRREELKKEIHRRFKRSRTSPIPKEITPCSEYTRFTLETVVEDPNEPGKNAIFESRSMGTLFKSGDYKEIKWSDKLGYGMAVVDDEVKLMVHTKGKMVIRRALDRDYAEVHFLAMKSLILPSMYCAITGQTLWEILVGAHLAETGVFPEPSDDPHKCRSSILTRIALESSDIEHVMRGYSNENQTTGRTMRDVIKELLSGDRTDAEETSHLLKDLHLVIEERLKEISRHLLDSGTIERGEFVGRSSFLLSASRSLEGLSEWAEGMETSRIPFSPSDAAMILRPWDGSGGMDVLVEKLSLDDLLRKRYLGLFECMMFLTP
ncbi:MAG: hypothetical protein KAH57_08720 [Thermoplasmata archaeon]|nr:hypothetical protein [Thermoplasmata archaeon]